MWERRVVLQGMGKGKWKRLKVNGRKWIRGKDPALLCSSARLRRASPAAAESGFWFGFLVRPLRYAD